MIIRALRLRHGRLALPRALTSINSLQRRYQTTIEEQPTSGDPIATPSFTDSNPFASQAQIEDVSEVRTVAINDPNHPVALDYAFLQHQKAWTQHLGSSLAPHYKPHELLSNPPRPQDITLELLLASQAHIGHATSLWHPANARYIFGIRGRKQDGESPIHIISLDATAAHLRRACKIVSGVTERGGLVLFVGTREGQARAVVKAAQMAQGCHLFSKWIPGSITNGQQILGRCAKKVVDEYDNEVPGFEDQLRTKAALKPDLVVCLNPLENYVLLHECGLNNIPTVGIVDTDVNPTWVTYPIPANDDSLRCVQVIAGTLGRAGEEGQTIRMEKAARGQYPHNQSHGLTEPGRSVKPKRTFQDRQKKPLQSTSTVVAEEPAFPQGLEGVEVKQYEQDQKLLQDAENVVLDELQPAHSDYSSELSETDLSQGGSVVQETTTNIPSSKPPIQAFHSPAATTKAPIADEYSHARLNSLEEEEDGDEDSSGLFSSEIDASLLNEYYASATETPAEEEAEDFGGADQLLQSQTGAPESLSTATTSIPSSEPDLQATQAPEATIDQVDEVEKELGEDAKPESGVSEDGETPDEESAVPNEAPTNISPTTEAEERKERKK